MRSQNIEKITKNTVMLNIQLSFKIQQHSFSFSGIKQWPWKDAETILKFLVFTCLVLYVLQKIGNL